MKYKSNTSVKKYIAIAVTAIFALGLLSACGGSEDETSTEATEVAKATVTAEEAAEKAAQDKNNQESTQRVKTGTEDGAIDAVQSAAYEDIKDYDGKCQNMSVDVGDTITTIDFDWNGNHYQYKYDQESGQIIR